MKRLIRSTLAIAALIAGHMAVSAEEKPVDPVRLIAGVTGALVRVEYRLQYDKADAPRGGLGNERCPNCGQYHSSELKSYLEQERPVETAGYLVASNRVVTVDPLIHSRFLQNVTVRFQGQSVPGTVMAIARERRAAVVALDAPLRGATPLQFTSLSAASGYVVTYSLEGGQWVTGTHPFPKQIVIPDETKPYNLTTLKGVAVSPGGAVGGVVLGNRLTLDHAWQGSPLAWQAEPVAKLTGELEKLAQETRAGLVRVHLGFRSPKSSDQDREHFTTSRRGEETGEATTEANVIGVLLPQDRVLILANLKPRVTARLDRITVHPPQGEPVTAKFAGSLKDFGALVATLDKPLPGAIPISEAALLGLREQMMLRADVSLQGETRSEYFQSARISSCEIGPRQQLYPQLDEPEPDNAFLFTCDHRLLALPISRRSKVSGERYSYEQRGIDLTPARYVADAIAALPAAADASNVPVSEADENRLAWLGLELQPLNRDLARANGVSAQTRDGETGALVTYVHGDSPAAKAGITSGAVLLRLTSPGQPLPIEVQLEEDYTRARPFPWDRLDEVPEQFYERMPTPWPSAENTFTRALTELGFGARVTAEFFVDGRQVSKAFEVAPGPPHYASAPRYKSEALGLIVRDLTYDVLRYMQRKADEPGVVVAKIEPGSKAGVAGVKPYELITHVNDQPVRSVKDFERLVPGDSEVKLSIKRMNKGRMVTVKGAVK